MSTVKVFSKIMANGGVSFNNSLETLPLPKDSAVGDSCIYDGQFWLYMSYSNVLGWVSLFSMDKTYVHIQESAAAVWTITHNMDSMNFIATTFDSDSRVVNVDVVALDANTVRVDFGTPTYGRVVLMFDAKARNIETAMANITADDVLGLEDYIIEIAGAVEPVVPEPTITGASQWKDFTVLNATAGTQYSKSFDTPDPDLLRNIVVWKFIPGTDGVKTVIASDFDNLDAAGFELSDGLVFDGTMRLALQNTTVPATHHSTVGGGEIYTIDIDFSQFDELHSVTIK